MALIEIPKGIDIEINFIAKINRANDLPFDLTDAEEIEIKIYQDREDIIATYTLTGNEVYIIDVPNGLLKFYIDRTATELIPSGVIFLQITIDITDGSSFKRSRLTQQPFGNIIDVV
jgi:hypothetical protein